ncbi:MAG: hypothetical protein U0797_01280 [Gemmataceae bacterium]
MSRRDSPQVEVRTGHLLPAGTANKDAEFGLGNPLADRLAIDLRSRRLGVAAEQVVTGLERSAAAEQVQDRLAAGSVEEGLGAEGRDGKLSLGRVTRNAWQCRVAVAMGFLAEPPSRLRPARIPPSRATPASENGHAARRRRGPA